MIRIYLYLTMAMVIPLLLGIAFNLPYLIGLSIFSLLFSLGMAYETLEKMKIVLQRRFKSGALPRLLEFIFTHFEYISNQKIARSILIKSQLISDEISQVDGEDFMRFKFDNTGIMFCETIVYRLNRSDGAAFQGVFLVASFNKKFTSQTVVLPRSSVSLLNKLWQREVFDNFQMVKLEDNQFNKEFSVYSTDQVESRYLLSVALMSRMLSYKQKIKRKISFSFVDDKMFCAIPNHDNLFEPAIFNSFLDFGFMLKSYNALKFYTDIVSDLNLNLRIWTKE